MWAIKFLSGPCAGKEFILQNGLVVLGRAESCEVQIKSSSVSKKHAQIIVKDSGLSIEDLNSSNGIFYKGKKIKSQKLKQGDRIAIHDIIFEVKKKTQPVMHPYFQQTQQNYESQEYASNETSNLKNKKELDFQNIQKGMKGYIHNVILPGIYKLAEIIEFKWLVAIFMVVFVTVVITFSSVPLVQILKSSVEQEGKNHAESIAVTLSKLNRKSLQTGLNAGLTVDYAQRRPGVKKAYIINAVDGRILAPSELAQTYPKDSFIHKARKNDRTTIQKIGKTIAAAVPIEFYNPETGENTPVAYSIVMYDIGTLSVDGTTILSLLVQNLFIAGVIGFILFFFLINLIEFPIRSISHQLNESLKDSKTASVSTLYQSQVLSDLCTHINSALNQISLNQMLNKNKESAEDLNQQANANRSNEMTNLVEIIGYPALSIDLESNTVAAINSNFSDQLGYNDILNIAIEDISENDLKEHLKMLVEQGQASPGEISFGEIVLQSITAQTACQFIMGQNQPAYAVVIFMPSEEGTS